MNERIQKLAEQAHLYACEHAQTPDYNPHNPYNKSMYKQRYDSKFAELIIQECIASIRALDNDAPYDEWTSGYTSAIISAAEAVEERFGIKE